jgi:hypothetical protein
MYLTSIECILPVFECILPVFYIAYLNSNGPRPMHHEADSHDVKSCHPSDAREMQVLGPVLPPNLQDAVHNPGLSTAQYLSLAQ